MACRTRRDRTRKISPSCASDQPPILALLRLAGGDRRLALEQQSGALDDRDVDHLAVDSDSAHTFGQRLVIGSDDAAGVVDLLRIRPELLVEDRHLARMDHRGADKTESTRTSDRLPKAVEIVELSNRADKAQWHDSGGAGSEHGHLLWHR